MLITLLTLDTMMSVLHLLTPIDPRIVLQDPQAALTVIGVIDLLLVERVHHLHIQ